MRFLAGPWDIAISRITCARSSGWREVQEILRQSIDDAGERTATYLTTRLHAAMDLASWTQDIAETVFVRYKDGSFEVAFTLETADQVWDWEDRTHVIRRFVNRMEAMAGEFFVDESLRNMSSAGVI